MTDRIFGIIISFLLLIPFQNRGQSNTDGTIAIQKKVDSLNRESEEFNWIDLDVYLQNGLEAYSLSDSIHYQLGMVRSQIDICRYYDSKKKYSECIEGYFNALEIAKSNNFNFELGIIYRSLGYSYVDLKRYIRAKEFLEKAVILNTQTHNFNQKAFSLCDLGKLYYQTGMYHKALTNYYLVFTFFDSITLQRAKLQTYRGLGTVYFYKCQYSWALYYFHKAIQLGIENNLIHELGPIYTLIAHVYQKTGNIQQRLVYNKKALDVRERSMQTEHVGSSLVNIGTIFLEINQLDSAEHYIVHGMEMLENSKDYHLISYAYNQLFTLAMRQGDIPKALGAFQLYKSSVDSLETITNKSEIELLETNHRIAEIERKNEALSREVEIQTLELENRSYSELITQFIIGAIGALFLILAYIFERNKLGKSKLETINKKLNKEVEERKLTEVHLRTSEELYRFVTEHTLDLIVRMDRNFNYLFISPSILRMFGYSAEDKDNLPAIRDLIPEDFQEELRSEYLEMIRTKEPVMLTHQSERKDGSLFWSESLVNPIFDKLTGKLKETITVIRDITDRVAYEESLSENARQKELLLREIHHRVKNNFAILVSLMNMQKVNSDPGDFNGFLTELQGRIRTMSLVHELLYRSHDIDYIHFGEYLGQLISIISRAYNDNPVKIHSSIEICILDVETALPLGLISNEILTNAYKYAFSGHPDGELWIDLQRCPDAANPEGLYTHTLTIRDNGPGLPKDYSPENQKSMGSQIISLLIDQLEGRLEFSGEEGATFTIYFSDEKRS